jgi:hypothetical protein
MSVSAFLLDPATSHDKVIRLVALRWRELEQSEYLIAVGLRRLFRDQVHRGKCIGSPPAVP